MLQRVVRHSRHRRGLYPGVQLPGHVSGLQPLQSQGRQQLLLDLCHQSDLAGRGRPVAPDLVRRHREHHHGARTPPTPGPSRPSSTKFVEAPFTDEPTEYNALLGGKLQVGYLPLANVTKATTNPLVVGGAGPAAARTSTSTSTTAGSSPTSRSTSTPRVTAVRPARSSRSCISARPCRPWWTSPPSSRRCSRDTGARVRAGAGAAGRRTSCPRGRRPTRTPTACPRPRSS